MHLWYARRGDVLIPTDDASLRVIWRLGEGECVCFERIAERDPVAHRRYWALMALIAHHVDRMVIDEVQGRPVYMKLYGSKDNVHLAMKLATGLYDTLPVSGTNYAIHVPKSIAFASMTPDEWNAYWPRVMDVVYQVVFPKVSVPEVQTEILRCLGAPA